MMSAAAAAATPSRFRGSTPAKADPLPAPPQRRPGVDEAALTELRNAAATYDFLRKKGDPAQFWEMLRLARNRRAIVAPPEGEAPAPSPEAQAAIVNEVESIRRNYAQLVRDLRGYLKKLSGLPEPAARLEMALAFLLASARELQAVAKWLAEPGKHEVKAAEKLRSLAGITDPYRESLLPWTLEGPPGGGEAGESAEFQIAEPSSQPAPVEPARAPASPMDPGHQEIIRQAVQCREILRRARLESELWETLLWVTTDPEGSKSALEALTREPGGDLLKMSKADRAAFQKLYDGVNDLRQMYAEWVHSLRNRLEENRQAPADSRAFEVGLSLMLCTPEAQDRLPSWLEDPDAGQQEALDHLHPWMRRAENHLAVLK
jgi:hypothetical protein